MSQTVNDMRANWGFRYGGNVSTALRNHAADWQKIADHADTTPNLRDLARHQAESYTKAADEFEDLW
jgi:hypothetical protein